MNAPTEALHRSSNSRPGYEAAKPAPKKSGGHGSSPAPAPPVRTGRLALILIVLAVAGLVIGFWPRWNNRQAVREENRALSVPTVTVLKAAAAKAPPPLALSGELKALVEASIYARASGYVRRWLVDLGAHVEEGQLLAELDTPEIDRQLSQARAELTQIQAARDLSATTAKRWQDMLAGKTVSKQEADEKAADLQTKKAAVEGAVANVERLQELAGFGRVVAPFAGTITARKIDVGQLVNAGDGQELFHLAQTEKLRLFVRVPQTFSRAIKPGEIAELSLPELPNRNFQAKVVRTAGAIDAASRTLLTELEVDNAKGEILTGSFAQVRFPDAKAEAPMTLPPNALLFRPDGPQVAIVHDNRAHMQAVTLGRDFGSAVEILNGVKPDDEVILNPADSLNEGAEVRVAPAPAGSAQAPAAH